MRSRIDRLRRQLADDRGGRVVLLSHRLLNEDTRYLGGAGPSGGVPEVAGNVRPGEGLFARALRRRFADMGVHVEFEERGGP